MTSRVREAYRQAIMKDEGLPEPHDVEADDSTLLHLAVERGNEESVKFLLSNNCQLNITNQFGLSPLMLSVRNSFPSLTSLLLSHGANVNFVNAQGQTALHYACSIGNDECLQHLLKHKPKLNVQDQEGVTPLIIACKMKHPNIVKTILAHKAVAKANPDICDNLKRSPLHWAAEFHDEECATALIHAHADINVTDKDMETPFVRAIKRNGIGVFHALLNAGYDISNIDGLNGTAMTMACLLGRNEMITKLIELGEDVNEFGHIGMSPLTSAVFESHVEAVRILLQSGADPNLPSRMGCTPLTKACSYIRESKITERHEITRLLLRANANPNHRVSLAGYFTSSTNGRNCALSFAISCGCMSLAKMHLIGGTHITLAEVLQWKTNMEEDGWFEDNNIITPLLQWVKHPKSLKFLCRRLIRDVLGVHPQEKIAKLPIPQVIKRYIDLQELDSINIEMSSGCKTSSGNSNEFSAMKAMPPCGLRNLQGTMSYEFLGSPHCPLNHGTAS